MLSGLMFSAASRVSPLRRQFCRSFSSTIDHRLKELGITLPPPGAPKANYGMACLAQGNMLYVSGHLPVRDDGSLVVGRLGDLSVEEGYEGARLCGINMLSTVDDRVGLDKVKRVTKIFGIVNSTLDFEEQHLVLNGCSDLMIEVFGKERGYHARSAIGTNTLPLGMAVEVEGIFELEE
mmetsp:Transcript_1875/g.3458  ORF Transcript_1875/g.3458 Transcript_1875/m.3458 type:complete len:179 (+) Transcript_1875:129-665(+)